MGEMSFVHETREMSVGGNVTGGNDVVSTIPVKT